MKEPKKNKVKGNQFWKLRSSHGRKMIIESPEAMLESIYEFFELKASQTISRPDAIKSGDNAGTQFDIKTKDYPTLPELAHFLGFMTLQSWYNYKKRDGFLEVITHAQEIMYTWKIKGASVNTYNMSIVARELGLADKTEEIGNKQDVKVVVKPRK